RDFGPRLAQSTARLPAERCSRLWRVEVLRGGLAARLIEDHRPKGSSYRGGDGVDDLAHREPLSRAEVERLARGDVRGRKRQVRGDDVVDVDVVAHRRAVAAQDRTLAAQERADRSWDDATPVPVADAVDVPAPGDARG